MEGTITTGLDCQRDGCGLPLFIRHLDVTGEPMILHVHAAEPLPGGRVDLTLKEAGRNGCHSPSIVHAGLPWKACQPPEDAST